MSKKNILTILCAMAMFAFGMVSCSNEDPLPEQGTGNAPYSYNVEFDGDIEKFDAETRAAEWQDGDTIFLLFDVDGKQVDGRLVFDAATAKWALKCYAVIPDITSVCKAFYFEGGTQDAYEAGVTFTAQSAIYSDTEATYIKNGDVLTVKAHLKPQTGRIRFKGEPGTKFTLHGVKRYTSFTVAKCKLLAGQTAENLIVGSDGYTSYVHGTLMEERRQLFVVYEDVSFMANCNDNVLANGKSGSSAVPTKESYSGWKKSFDKVFTVNGVMFVMKYVQGGTFTMGATYEQSNEAGESEKPAHEVTLSDYYIGETEVTEALWEVVMNPALNSSGGIITPKNTISWRDCSGFIQRVNSLTEETFAFPTEAQWEYAARGGIASRGYKYSGSDKISEVAWYTQNSGGQKHPVASKFPNELGIYDMSGNLMEPCGDYEGNYSSDSVTDPTGPTSGSKRVYRGGHLNLQQQNCRVSSRSMQFETNASNYFGFRLALPAQ